MGNIKQVKDFLRTETVAAIHAREIALRARFIEGLPPTHLRILGDPSVAAVGVISFTIEDLPPQEAALLLDMQHGVQVRSGFHCAPRAHQALQTADHGGAVRVSVGAFTTPTEIEQAVAAATELASLTGG